MLHIHSASKVAWPAAVAALLWCGTAAGDGVDAAWRLGFEEQVEAAGRALTAVRPPSAVFVGEVHDRLPYHVNQLAVITALVEQGHNVAVGLEMIQSPFQQALDEFIAERIDFDALLTRTEYYSRWRYDARLYQPIFEFARARKLPLLALNAPAELTDRVSRVGIDGLDTGEREQLPGTLTPPAPGYRALLERVFSEHPETSGNDLERFIEVQRTWDEVMGRRAAAFLSANPDHVLVVLAGVQHVVKGVAVPRLVSVHSGAPAIVVLSVVERDGNPDSADIFLDLVEATLPEAGRMGVLIRPAVSGVVVDGFADDSPAEKAGARTEDRIVEIDGRPVESFADVKLALWDKSPGQTVEVTVSRSSTDRTTLSFELY